jgi:hypothetical protein
MQLPHRVQIDSRGMGGWRHGLRDDLPAWCSAHGAVWPPRRAVQLSKQAPCWLRACAATHVLMSMPCGRSEFPPLAGDKRNASARSPTKPTSSSRSGEVCCTSSSLVPTNNSVWVGWHSLVGKARIRVAANLVAPSVQNSRTRVRARSQHVTLVESAARAGGENASTSKSKRPIKRHEEPPTTREADRAAEPSVDVEEDVENYRILKLEPQGKFESRDAVSAGDIIVAFTALADSLGVEAMLLAGVAGPPKGTRKIKLTKEVAEAIANKALEGWTVGGNTYNVSVVKLL